MRFSLMICAVTAITVATGVHAAVSPLPANSRYIPHYTVKSDKGTPSITTSRHTQIYIRHQGELFRIVPLSNGEYWQSRTWPSLKERIEKYNAAQIVDVPAGADPVTMVINGRKVTFPAAALFNKKQKSSHIRSIAGASASAPSRTDGGAKGHAEYGEKVNVDIKPQDTSVAKTEPVKNSVALPGSNGLGNQKPVSGGGSTPVTQAGQGSGQSKSESYAQQQSGSVSLGGVAGNFAGAQSFPAGSCKASDINPDLPMGGLMYGSPVFGDSWGHTGKYVEASMRFVALRDGEICSIGTENRVYKMAEWNQNDGKGYNPKFACSNSDSNCKMAKMVGGGYHRGDGGRLRITLQTDDGKGLPSGKEIARASETYRPVGNNPTHVGTYQGQAQYIPGSYEHYPVMKMTSCAKVNRGQVYHIVLINESPQTGSVVLNGSFTNHKLSEILGGPFYGMHTLLTRSSGNGAWQDIRNHHDDREIMPDYLVVYGDGVVDGPAFAGIGGGKTTEYFGGGTKVKQTFVVKQADRQVNGLWARIGRKGGDAPLQVTLKQGGSTIASGSLAASAFKQTGSVYDGAVTWVYIPLPATTLKNGTRYDLEFSSAGGTSYFAGGNYPAITSGSSESYLNKARNYALGWGGTDSKAQVSTNGGGSWRDWSYYGKTSPSVDMPVLFTIVGKEKRFGC